MTPLTISFPPIAESATIEDTLLLVQRRVAEIYRAIAQQP
jgi:hypothetical protein